MGIGLLVIVRLHLKRRDRGPDRDWDGLTVFEGVAPHTVMRHATTLARSVLALAPRMIEAADCAPLVVSTGDSDPLTSGFSCAVIGAILVAAEAADAEEDDLAAPRALNPPERCGHPNPRRLLREIWTGMLPRKRGHPACERRSLERGPIEDVAKH